MDKRIQDFPAAEAFGDDDLLLVSQSGATKTVTGRLVKALAALGAKVFAERAESLATGVTMADLQSLIQCGSAGLAEGLPPGGILFVEEASG